MLKNMLPYSIFLFIQFLITASQSPTPEKADIQTFVYNFLNILSVFSLFLGLRMSNTKRIEKLSFIIMLALIIFGLFEAYGGAKDLFDSIRKLYTSESSMYTAEDRDLSQYGAIRPNVFTSEPSSVGNFFGSLWMLYFSINKSTWQKVILCSTLMVAAIFLFRTPTLPIYIGVGLILNLYVFNQKKLHAVWIAAISFLFALIILPYYIYSKEIPFISNSEFASEFINTGSFYIRQIAPVENFFYMIHDNRYFGYGYSYVDQMKSNNWADLNSKNPNFYDYTRISEMHGGQFISNAFWEFWVLNGLIGGFIFLLYVWLVLKNLGGRNPRMLAVCGACVWVSHAGIALVFTWIPIIFIAYILSLKKIFTEPTASLRITVCQSNL